MNNWNYRIVRHPAIRIEDEEVSDEFLAVHEAFYNKDGTLFAITEDPVIPMGENFEDLVSDLTQMLKDIRLSKDNILNLKDCNTNLLKDLDVNSESSDGIYTEF